MLRKLIPLRYLKAMYLEYKGVSHKMGLSCDDFTEFGQLCRKIGTFDCLSKFQKCTFSILPYLSLIPTNHHKRK